MTLYRTHYAVRLFLLSLFLSATASAQTTNECTENESWLRMGTGLPGAAIASTEMNGNLYVLYTPSQQNNRTIAYRISRWDGSAWHAVAGLELPPPVRQGSYTLTLKGYNGELYLGGNFASANDDFDLGYVIKWNGNAWVSAEANFQFGGVYTFEIHNGDLYSSAFIEREGTFQWKIIRWNGSGWEFVGPDSPLMKDAGTILRLRSLNGMLYATGKGVIRWDGTEWTRLGEEQPGTQVSVYDIAIYKQQLYAGGRVASQNGIHQWFARWNGTMWEQNFPSPAFTWPGMMMEEHDGHLYLLSTATRRIGNEVLNVTGIDRFDGNAWHDVSNTDGTIGFMGRYNGDLYIGGDFSASCGSPVNNIARMCPATTCGKISGTVFHDGNADCAQGNEEKGLPRRMVKISPGEYMAVTDDDGNYSVLLEPGAYTVSLAPYLYWNQICPGGSGGRTVTVSGTGSVSSNDFATQPVPGIQDLRVSMVTNRARQGRPLVYIITYENAGTVTMNGTVHFLYDPILTYASAQPVTTRRSQGGAEWDFTDLKAGESRTIEVWTTIPRETPMETDICSRVRVTPANVNVSSNGDRDSVCVPVTGSYDPNDIQVTPFGIEENGVIKPKDSVLTYWVRFQNTGNDTAFRIVVVDSLSSHLDISSIRLGAASHPFSFSIDKSNVLVWTFDDIMLPDSGASEENSHGFFKYSVKLKRDLPALTEIANQAHIYFDYNAPVATNTVVSILDAPMSADRTAAGNRLTIHPNPTRDRVTINARMQAGSRMALLTMLGETIAYYQYDGNGTMTVDLHDLPAGTYLLAVPTADGIITERLTVLK